jgi:DNA-binding NarL/FixJ family response regulator
MRSSPRSGPSGRASSPCPRDREIAPQHLSYREKQVLSLVAAGCTNRQIADQLFLAESTVKTHLASVFTKIGASSRAEAAAVVLDPDRGLGLTVPELTTAVAAP